MNAFVNLCDTIGYIGPLILFVITTFDLFYRKPYLYTYIVAFIINSYFNMGLKNLFRIPRQHNQIFFSKYENFDGANQYGMPSGHAQSLGFSLTFLHLAQTNVYICALAFFVAALSLYQRHKYRRHTIAELLVGLLIGALFAYFVFTGTTYYLETQTPTQSHKKSELYI